MAKDGDKKIIHLAQIKAAKKFAAGHGMSVKEYCAYLDRLKPEQSECSERVGDENDDGNAHYVFPLLHQSSDDNDNN
tara:strand:+ start:305 stop:535 length:231 start_codon:yes stop_codon:yes gene_type:complete